MLVFMTIFVGEMQIVFRIIHDMSVLREWEQYIYFVFIDEFQYPKVFSFGVFSKDGVSQADVRYQFLFTFSPFPLLVLSLSTISFLFLFPQWRKKLMTKIKLHFKFTQTYVENFSLVKKRLRFTFSEVLCFQPASLFKRYSL